MSTLNFSYADNGFWNNLPEQGDYLIEIGKLSGQEGACNKCKEILEIIKKEGISTDSDIGKRIMVSLQLTVYLTRYDTLNTQLWMWLFICYLNFYALVHSLTVEVMGFSCQSLSCSSFL